ncbi:MAG: hypothetical protein V2A56_07850, partial [bacterium]
MIPVKKQNIPGIFRLFLLIVFLAVLLASGYALFIHNIDTTDRTEVNRSVPSDSGWVRFIKPLYGDSVNIEMALLPLSSHRYLMTYQYRHIHGRRHQTVYVITDSLGNVLEHKPMPDPYH